MNLLISPARVAALAFRAPDFMTADAVNEATIVAAEQKFILPVVGRAMYEKLIGGEYETLLEEYLRPALAIYVKLLMLPALALQVGPAGVVEANPKYRAKASTARIDGAARRLRSDAKALMRRAVEAIEAAPGDYPEYDPRENILNRVSTAGGIVINR